MRASALKGVKELKAAAKEGATGPPEAPAAAGKALGEVLEACDWVRDTACPAVGVQIDDVSDTLSSLKAAVKK